MRAAWVFFAAARLCGGSEAPSAAALASAGAAFRRDGLAVLEGFADSVEVAAMKARMAELRASHDASAAEAHVFVTDERQGAQQAKSAHFFESAAQTSFFYEDDGETLNKCGHGLHLADDAFGRYSASPAIRTLLGAFGLEDPVLPQSMYIFKEAVRGGAVTSHQDATFLHTKPAQTVVGLWLALDDATLENGCLWARNGSHAEPIRRTFVRAPGEQYKMVFEETGAAPAPADYLDGRLLDAARRLGPKDAAAWEGKNVDAAAALKNGFVPLPVKAGTLVAFAGTLDHLSLPNESPHDRHTFQLHAVEGPGAGMEWSDSNWLQYTDKAPFPRLADRGREL